MTMRLTNGAETLNPCGGDAPASPPHQDDDLPADPFVALRVAYGMLLGEDDFRVLMGNPRGKQMLHAAWSHGPGVIWGYRVAEQDEQLVVGEGLAMDGCGRELRLRVSHCLDLDAWAERWVARHPAAGRDRGNSDTSTESAWVVARLAKHLAGAVPAMADPCDVTRRHDAYSRVLESVRFEITDEPPPRQHPYRRLRMLLGIADYPDPVARDVHEALVRIRSRPAKDRDKAMRTEIERLARCDAADRRPAVEPGRTEATEHPMAEGDAGVVVARLTIKVTRMGGTAKVREVVVHECAGYAAVPTATLFELITDLITRMVRHDPASDAGGPRLESVTWPAHGRANTVRLTFDKPVLGRTAKKAIQITSLAEDGEGWHREDVDDVAYDNAEQTRLLVRLDDSQSGRRVRVLVRGTGSMPLLGRDAVPFAGWKGGPRGTEDDGVDAADVQVLTPRHHTEEGSS
jgi:hypothetical protein